MYRFINPSFRLRYVRSLELGHPHIAKYIDSLSEQQKAVYFPYKSYPIITEKPNSTWYRKDKSNIKPIRTLGNLHDYCIPSTELLTAFHTDPECVQDMALLERGINAMFGPGSYNVLDSQEQAQISYTLNSMAPVQRLEFEAILLVITAGVKMAYDHVINSK